MYTNEANGATGDLEIETCFQKREKRNQRLDVSIAKLAQHFSVLKIERHERVKNATFNVYLAKLFIQILYNQTRVHRVRPRVTQRGGHVTTVIFVRLSVRAVNILESRASTGTKETSCDLIRDDHLEK